jgi:hypothetical protein
MKKVLLTAVAALALGATPAMAAHDLPVGDSGSPLSLAFPVPTGAKLADTGLQALSISQAGQTLSVGLRAAVYRGPTAGTLDFVYQVTNNAESTSAVEGLTFSPFDSFGIPGVWQTATGFDTFLNGVEGADSARRIIGNTIGFEFGTNFNPGNDFDSGASILLDAGETSAVFLVRVNAFAFRPGTFTVQDGLTITGIGFAPTVPEPATWAMMIGGFGLMGAAARRTRRAKTVLA